MSEDGGEVSEGGGGGGKMLLIVGLVVGLAGGAGVGFVLFGGGEPPAAEGDVVEEKEPEVVAPENLLTIQFERVAVPIYGETGGRRRFIGNYFINIDIQAETERNQLLVRQSEPRLRHSFADAISKRGLMRDDDPLQIDYDKARKEFMLRAKSLLGDDVVYDISISDTVRVSN